MNRVILILLVLTSGFWLGACSSADESESESKTNPPETPLVPIRRVEAKKIMPNTNRPEDIKAAGVKELKVQNCLVNTSCFSNHYSFNECGGVSTYYPGHPSKYAEYEYDDDCRVIAVLWKAGGNIHQSNRYSYLPNDSVQEDYYGDHVDDFKLLSSTRFKLKSSKDETSVYNDRGYVVQKTIGRLSYPCGYDFPGEHLARYNYYDNGLISYIQISDMSDSIVVEMEYTYYGNNDTIPLEFDVLE